MRHFWALPAALRIVVASKHAFSVHDDILAFPQFALNFLDDYVREAEASSLLQPHEPRQSPEPIEPSTALLKQDGNEPIPRTSKDTIDIKDAAYELLRRPDGSRHLCRIPILDPADEIKEVDNSTVAARREQEAKELEQANTRGWQLLSEMQGHCLYYWSGWWSYRYCFGDGVKQFHQLPPQPGLPAHPPIEDPNVTGFMLGLVGAGEDKQDKGGVDWDDDEEEGAKEVTPSKESALAAVKANGQLETRGDVKYLVQKLGGGSICDMTGGERQTEVQFHCSPTTTDHIGLIKETSTCKYLMVINTPRLCNDAAFLPPQRDSPNAITCSPILQEHEVEEYETHLKSRETKRKLIAQGTTNPFLKDTTSQALPRVGNIVVGAHKHIPEGRELKKTAIVGGGKETLVDIIADSMGKFLSPEKLKELGISDPKQVEAFKKQLDRIAGDKGWKLEVVDTARGTREYRGIIGDDDATDELGGQRQEGGDASGRVEYERSKYEEQKKQAAAKSNGQQGGAIKDKTDQSNKVMLDGEQVGEVGSVEEMMDLVKEHLGKEKARRQRIQDLEGSYEQMSDEEKAEQELQRLEEGEDMVIYLDDPNEPIPHDEL